MWHFGVLQTTAISLFPFSSKLWSTDFVRLLSLSLKKPFPLFHNRLQPAVAPHSQASSDGSWDWNVFLWLRISPLAYIFSFRFPATPLGLPSISSHFLPGPEPRAVGWDLQLKVLYNMWVQVTHGLPGLANKEPLPSFPLSVPLS